MEAFTVTCRIVAQFFLQQKLKYNERLKVFMALRMMMICVLVLCRFVVKRGM
jgi:hypothetical protein